MGSWGGEELKGTPPPPSKWLRGWGQGGGVTARSWQVVQRELAGAVSWELCGEGKRSCGAGEGAAWGMEWGLGGLEPLWPQPLRFSRFRVCK